MHQISCASPLLTFLDNSNPKSIVIILVPDSRFPTPYSLFPVPYSLFPTFLRLRYASVNDVK
ncbi:MULTISPECIES: hypothetical protein [unclassified Moorena]|uniref:hypothetical protein n=1 Tax=unclassified Moorena TaxID=2683338 RepID=UPI0014182CD3|nr:MULTISPECIES: hypothetical protein [unclassified Moorena]NEO17290.1 hypothetical protein [Moorena sp. SIO3E8]